jgi:hypothetical protein
MLKGVGCWPTPSVLASRVPDLTLTIDAREANARMGLQAVSQSTVSQIRSRSFRNVQIKLAGSNFSRCTECNFLRCCISKYPKDCPKWQALIDDRTRHINYQNAYRRIYRGWSTQFVESPSQFLYIIHDKIDHTKTTIPRMQRITKATSGLGLIPISLTGMLTHGHGDGAYAHYSTALWPADSNFTISSLCRVLRALERAPVKQSKELFRAPPQNSFFDALLHRKS